MKEQKNIYMSLAHMSGYELRYINEAFATNWVVPLGPNVNGFESDLENYIARNHSHLPREEGEKRVCVLSSGTAAVHLGLLNLGVGKGDEVICQSLTFCASVNPAVYLGAKPIFIDSERDTYNMDPAIVEFAIKDRIQRTGRVPKAIVVVHLYGMPSKIDEISKVADKYGIPIMEDAAEAMGSKYKGRLCGTFGQYGVWSFNGNKMITTSGGGALICPDGDSKKRSIFYATQAKEPTPYYQHEEVGYNYRLSNISAGIGRGQMHAVDSHVAHHKYIHEAYSSAFQNDENVSVHTQPSLDMDSNYWLTTILLSPEAKIIDGDKLSKIVSVHSEGGQPNDNVEQLRQLLENYGIESRALWKPLHCMPVYGYSHYKKSFVSGIKILESDQSAAYVNGTSEELFQRGLCLPSGPCVSSEDVSFIVDCIKSAVR